MDFQIIEGIKEVMEKNGFERYEARVRRATNSSNEIHIPQGTAKPSDIVEVYYRVTKQLKSVEKEVNEVKEGEDGANI